MYNPCIEWVSIHSSPPASRRNHTRITNRLTCKPPGRVPELMTTPGTTRRAHHHRRASHSTSPFDSIRQTDDQGNEFWSARDLAPLMGYSNWQNFQTALERAKASAKAVNLQVSYHFIGSSKVVTGGRWGSQSLEDCNLTRMAAYLVAMNGDPRKPEVAKAQAYFAIMTRAAETAQPTPEAPAMDPNVAAVLEALGTTTALLGDTLQTVNRLMEHLSQPRHRNRPVRRECHR